MKTAAATSVRIQALAERERFYAYMAAICLAVAVIGFAPSYWVPLYQGSLDVAPIAHLHAILFYGWMLLFLWQTYLISAGRLERHREFGVAGVARWFIYFLAPPPATGAIGPSAGPPVALTVLPGLVINLLIVAAMIHDRRTSGRVHPVYWVAGGTVLAVQVLRIPLSSTSAWDQLALWLAALSP
jgi:hypothetical protein